MREAGPEAVQAHRGQSGATPHRDAYLSGVLTLAEVQAATGVTADHIRARLGLPETVSDHERLGVLRRRFRFEISAVRRIVREYEAPVSPSQ